MSNPNKYTVNLSEAERERLKQISRNDQAPAKKILHARILLLADQTYADGGWTDERIGEALGLSSHHTTKSSKRGNTSTIERRLSPRLQGQTTV